MAEVKSATCDGDSLAEYLEFCSKCDEMAPGCFGIFDLLFEKDYSCCYVANREYIPGRKGRGTGWKQEVGLTGTFQKMAVDSTRGVAMEVG